MPARPEPRTVVEEGLSIVDIAELDAYLAGLNAAGGKTASRAELDRLLAHRADLVRLGAERARRALRAGKRK